MQTASRPRQFSSLVGVGSVGAEIAISLAYANPSQILLGRTLSKISPVIGAIHSINPSITTNFVHIDLASLASVQNAAEETNSDSEVEKINFIINNAILSLYPLLK